MPSRRYPDGIKSLPGDHISQHYSLWRKQKIDYAITPDGIQTFEINTNPTIIDTADLSSTSRRKKNTDIFISKIRECLGQLES